MKLFFTLLTLTLILSCGNDANKPSKLSTGDSIAAAYGDYAKQEFTLSDATTKFLWRDRQFVADLGDTFSVLVLNDAYTANINDAERAALGYVATFIGNECQWDGEGKEDRSNLKCKILSQLNLGYQCSAQHLDFLRYWFRNDPKALESLQNCPTTPDGATIQETFDEITVRTKGDIISVKYNVSGMNMREGEEWHYTQKDHFSFSKNQLKLVKQEKSDVVSESMGDMN
ncbi:MAG: hypothetical protein CFE21_13820 [Bacteroidetes bacterium B1(2017)]|nr:MAG: hypothetical protein CFE21_13820 [Bacteroidetes bacterium B1(2017)]